MRIAYAGANYCWQYQPVPEPHEAVWLPLRPSIGEMFAETGLTPDWADALVIVLVETLPIPFDLEQAPCKT
ncbi:MAG: hypothetical protein O3A46_07630, partial [Candidatus Poribacteria bacterium]|nr:hypothetical protein [Candidatus Poribacteria bacterium]